MNISKITFWIARLVAAIIMLQTLFFKFSGSAESIYIFTTVGMEPWGRYGVGTMEFIASALLLVNRTVWLGALLAIGLMVGALGMHFTLLGIEVQGDGGQLFIYALIVFLSAAYALYFEKDKVMEVIRKFF